MNIRTNEWTNERTNEQTNERTNEVNEAETWFQSHQGKEKHIPFSLVSDYLFVHWLHRDVRAQIATQYTFMNDCMNEQTN